MTKALHFRVAALMEPEPTVVLEGADGHYFLAPETAKRLSVSLTGAVEALVRNGYKLDMTQVRSEVFRACTDEPEAT